MYNFMKKKITTIIAFFINTFKSAGTQTNRISNPLRQKFSYQFVTLLNSYFKISQRFFLVAQFKYRLLVNHTWMSCGKNVKNKMRNKQEKKKRLLIADEWVKWDKFQKYQLENMATDWNFSFSFSNSLANQVCDNVCVHGVWPFAEWYRFRCSTKCLIDSLQLYNLWPQSNQ